LRFERVDVVVGALMTGVIGFFVVVACAATLHQSGQSIDDARDAAVALRPLAGSFAAALFAAGLIGAALLAASILPLSTAYSVSEALGYEAGLNDRFHEAPLFYSTYGAVVVVSAALVLIPGAPLVYGIVRDREVMGQYAAGRTGTAAALAVIALLAISVATLAVLIVL
jgi:Mn2+/Fe2+ NRAMP family transporter